MRDVFVIGAGQTPVTRSPEATLAALGSAAIHAALTDARVDADAITALFVGNMASGILSSQLQLGSLLADYCGLPGIEALTVESACASGGAAARVAYQSIASGMHEIAIVCGVEQLTHVDRPEATRALAMATDWELEGSKGESFISINAALMQAYVDRFAPDANAFAPFSITAHLNALDNEYALLHKHVDIESYNESRLVHAPLRLFDISPICDGAAAIVLASERLANEALKNDRPRIRIAASSMASAPPSVTRRSDPLWLDAVEVSTRRALDNASMQLTDIDVAELHDAYTIMTVLSLEAAGFAEPGRGWILGQNGAISLTGEIPIATFGGLKARGHPVGATGVYQLVEAYLQLSERAGRNQVESAETALVQNIGGTASTVVSHILQRVA